MTIVIGVIIVASIVWLAYGADWATVQQYHQDD